MLAAPSKPPSNIVRQIHCPRCGVVTITVRRGQVLAMPDPRCRRCQREQRDHYDMKRLLQDIGLPSTPDTIERVTRFAAIVKRNLLLDVRNEVIERAHRGDSLQSLADWARDEQHAIENRLDRNGRLQARED